MAQKLNDVRKAINEKKGTISQIIKGMYAFDDCKELKALLPKNKKDLLNITGVICKEMGIGETYVVKIKEVEHKRVRKPSFDLVLRYLVRHQDDLDSIIKANSKPAKVEEPASEK